MNRCFVGWRLAVASLVVWIAGCAGVLSMTQTPTPTPTIDRDSIRAFSLAARLAITRGDERVTVNIDWQHAPGSDTLTVRSPLGQTLAELSADPQGAVLRMGEHDSLSAPDLETLAARALGAPLPLAGLPHWVLGRAASDEARGVRDALGRWASLDDGGWKVVFAQYDSDMPEALPRLINLNRGEWHIRLRNDQWTVRP